MNLYRLDHIDGTPVEDIIGRDYLCHNFARARGRARIAADESGQVVQITRISGGGLMKVTCTVRPKPAR